MRTLILITLITFCGWSSMAQCAPTREETVKWLGERFTQERSLTGQRSIQHNSTAVCKVNRKIAHRALTDKDFTTKIESYISWNQRVVEIQNDVFEDGKLRETYTYQVPLCAIVSAGVTGCQKNNLGYVNAYRDRPLFIHVANNAIKVGHTSFDKNGKSTRHRSEQYHSNTSDLDWDSFIPIAGDWDSDPALAGRVMKALSRLIELNQIDRQYRSSQPGCSI